MPGVPGRRLRGPPRALAQLPRAPGVPCRPRGPRRALCPGPGLPCRPLRGPGWPYVCLPLVAQGRRPASHVSLPGPGRKTARLRAMASQAVGSSAREGMAQASARRYPGPACPPAMGRGMKPARGAIRARPVSLRASYGPRGHSKPSAARAARAWPKPARGAIRGPALSHACGPPPPLAFYRSPCPLAPGSQLEGGARQPACGPPGRCPARPLGAPDPRGLARLLVGPRLALCRRCAAPAISGPPAGVMPAWLAPPGGGGGGGPRRPALGPWRWGRTGAPAPLGPGVLCPAGHTERTPGPGPPRARRLFGTVSRRSLRIKHK